MATVVIPNAINVDKLHQDIKSIPTKPTLKSINGADYAKLKKQQNQVIQKVSKAHIESFDFMLDEGLPKGVKHIKPLHMELPNGKRLKVWINDVTVGEPRTVKDSNARNAVVYPSECRIRGTSYMAKLHVTFSYSIDGKGVDRLDEIVGDIPIMLKSRRCNLRNMTPTQLVNKYEDAEEIGGYFIVNGNERVVRFLTAQRRNYPMALVRKSWADSGQLFTEYGVQLRSVRPDQIGTSMILHYLSNGTTRLKIWYQKMPIFLPIVMVLKALKDCSDEYIYREMVKGKEDDTFYCSCAINMVRLVQQEGLKHRQQIKEYIGSRLRVKFKGCPWLTDEQITEELFSECIATHLTNDDDKFNLLILMQRKVFALAKGECAPENPDNPMFHEIYLSGHIYFALLIERLDMFLSDSLKIMINKTVEMQVKSGKAVDLSVSVMRKCLNAKYGDIVRPMNSLIATGNLQSKSGLGLMQTSGLAVMAEKINFWRFMSHFRAVHRGSFFAEMKTTTCRKLYPEAWGFLCPVHTPDGAPCGLLNHLSEMCLVTNNQESVTPVVTALQSLGMEGHKSLVLLDFSKCYTVILDGKVIGHIRDSDIHRVISELRTMKATQSNKISATLEIGFVPKTTRATQYPGLFLFSNPARMVRPVYNLKAQCLELIGTFEQPYLEVCVAQEEAHPKTTHQELSETSILSVLASMIPFPDFNQSPRNMYACQMGKQTMGTASHTLKFRSDSKMYATNCGQTPLVRPTMHDHYQLDEYPMGTNAVVAVISYTGYDMEDALILNKSSVERGFKHGQITKTVVVDLRELAGISSGSKETVYVFGSIAGDASSHPDKLDKDGLPFIGTKLEFDDPMCSYIDTAKGVTVVKHYASTEVAYVQDVVLLGSDNGKDVLQKIAIKLYIPRVPIIGDKFANRHGQKGVSSFLWPQESMPFTTSGLTPDIIFNPHGFPSRMTIGMMLESMAGKTGSHFGTVHDATPFTFSEDEVASEHFGTLLEKAGYNYYGTERMYSGVSGQELVADIFVGVIYYIRLRHMVGDKYQVRSTGPIDQMTHQPIKGRKRAGGIRFGEMERDSLLAHGTSFLLQDRLFNCSDKSSVYACSKCMSIVSTFCSNQNDAITNSPEIWSCRVCNTGAHVKLVSLPYVLKYLVAELASVNIKCNFKTT